MRNALKRLLSLVLVLAMVCSMLPATALARTTEDAQTMVYGRYKLPDSKIEYLVNRRLDGVLDMSDSLPAGFTLTTAEPLADTSAYEDLEGAADQLRAGILARQNSIVVRFRTPLTDSDNPFRKVLYEAFSHTGNPVEGDYMGWQWHDCRGSTSTTRDNVYYYYDITYSMAFDTTAAQEAELDRAARQLLDQLDVYDRGDYYKVKAVYDWICANITYDHDNVDETFSHTAYAALINRTAVCEGYALLMYRLLLTLGVDNRLIASVDHGYNIIQLGDLYYYGDTTWDAGSSPSQYRYFLQNERNFEDRESHIRIDCSPYYGWDYD